MFRIRSHKTRLGALLMAFVCALHTGCASNQNDAAGSSKKSSTSSRAGEQGARTPGSIADGDYYSSDWLARQGLNDAEVAPRPGDFADSMPIVRDSRGRPLGSGTAPAPAPAPTPLPQPAALGSRAGKGSEDIPPMPSEDPALQQTGMWSLVLATFTDGNARESAARMISETKKVAPEVNGLRVFPSGNHAMVVYGEYTGRDDPRQTADKNWLKSIKYQNRVVFPRIMLTHLDFRPLQKDLHPYDLNYARREHPKVNPLYTLDVAVWDDLDSGKLPYDQIRRKAEAYTKQLRMTGYEAYFYHDDVAKRSMVTVGLFDKTAINSISGLYSDAVVDLMKRFPARMVNGEEVLEPKDRFRPQLGTKPQSPLLVEVPE